MISSSSFCADDVEELSPLIFEAFRQVAEARGFTPDFLCSEEVRTMLQHYVRMGEDCLGIVLRDEKRVIVGGNFACHEGDSVFCVGPVFATKEAPPGTGRRVMHEIMDLTKAKGCRSLRLTQAGYNMVSLSLYIKMGFVVREHLSAVDVIALRHDLEIPSGTRARIATKKDIESMEKLCFASHGHVRRLDIRDTVEEGEAAVVEGPCGQVKGYCTSCGPEGHAVAESNDYLFAGLFFLFFFGTIFLK